MHTLSNTVIQSHHSENKFNKSKIKSQNTLTQVGTSIKGLPLVQISTSFDSLSTQLWNRSTFDGIKQCYNETIWSNAIEGFAVVCSILQCQLTNTSGFLYLVLTNNRYAWQLIFYQRKIIQHNNKNTFLAPYNSFQWDSHQELFPFVQDSAIL